jgi:iron complex outermembrane receptor protein
MDYDDQLVLTGEINNVGDPVMTNVPKSYRAGIEIISGFKICKKLRWDMNFTLSRNKIKNFTSYIDQYDTDGEFAGQKSINLGETDLSFSPNYTGSSIFTFNPVKNLNISLISKYVGDQFIDNTSSRERMLKSYFLNNLQIRYSLKTKLTKDISLYFHLNNIFNKMYESNAWVYSYYISDIQYDVFGFFPQAGINFMAGISVKF